MANVFLRNPNAAGPWQFDTTNNRYFLEINGTQVAWIDANGNMAIKGRNLKIQ